jgi:hypothetical protein
MASKTILSRRNPISITATLATADDLNGTSDNTQAFDITGVSRIIIEQVNNGTAGTLGIDVIEYSFDGGSNWSVADDLVPDTANDFTGTHLTTGILNAAGTEPATDLIARWAGGPKPGPWAVRCIRNTSVNAAAVDWTTGAPSVYLIAIGGNHEGGALTALA